MFASAVRSESFVAVTDGLTELSSTLRLLADGLSVGVLSEEVDVIASDGDDIIVDDIDTEVAIS